MSHSTTSSLLIDDEPHPLPIITNRGFAEIADAWNNLNDLEKALFEMPVDLKDTASNIRYEG
jgi:hypothetical protein